MHEKLVVFNGKGIRRVLQNGEWLFAVVDVVAVLTDSEKPRDYWYRMKKRGQTTSGPKLSTKCRQLKLESTKVVSLENYLTEPERKKRLKR
jgi:hypothetical protein